MGEKTALKLCMNILNVKFKVIDETALFFPFHIGLEKKKSLKIDNHFLPGLIIPRIILCRLTNAGYIYCCCSHSHKKLMCILSLSVYNPKLLGEFSDLDLYGC